MIKLTPDLSYFSWWYLFNWVLVSKFAQVIDVDCNRTKEEAKQTGWEKQWNRYKIPYRFIILPIIIVWMYSNLNSCKLGIQRHNVDIIFIDIMLKNMKGNWHREYKRVSVCAILILRWKIKHVVIWKVTWKHVNPGILLLFMFFIHKRRKHRVMKSFFLPFSNFCGNISRTLCIYALFK